MGRRALKKYDPTLDLSRHLFEVDQLAVPLDVDSLFGRSAPLEIEVGSGKGLFMATASGEYPQRNFLGCEIAGKYASFAAAKLAKAERDNAIMLRGDGLKLFRELLRDACAAAVHVYFPDPWWKSRHRRRRVMNETFLKDIQRVLEPGGKLHFWSDVQEYFQSTLELIAEVTDLSEPMGVAVSPAENDLDYRTHFERRMRLHDVPVYRAEFRKT